MSVRLTKAMREEIVEKIYKASDLPKRKEALRALVKKSVRDMVFAMLPQEFVELTKKLPKERIEQFTGFYVGRDYYDICGYGSWHRVDFDDPISVPYNYSLLEEERAKVHAWMNINYVPVADAIEADESKLRDTSWALVNSFRTAGRLLKEAPELKAYIPIAVTSMLPAIPVSNALSEMMQRGVAMEAA